MPAGPVRFSILLALVALLGGCAAQTQQTERQLVAAGFQMRMADTPEKLTQIEALPQRKLVPKTHDGRPFFLFADAKHCKCLYVGTERAYRRYTRIAMLKHALDEQREIAEAREAAAMNLNAWGPWAPWWY